MGSDIQKRRAGLVPKRGQASNGTKSMDKLMIKAPSPSVSLMEIAYIQQKIAPPRRTPTRIALKQSDQEASFNALIQNGSKQSDANKKRMPIKPKGGKP